MFFEGFPIYQVHDINLLVRSFKGAIFPTLTLFAPAPQVVFEGRADPAMEQECRSPRWRSSTPVVRRDFAGDRRQFLTCGTCQ